MLKGLREVILGCSILGFWNSVSRSPPAHNRTMHFLTLNLATVNSELVSFVLIFEEGFVFVNSSRRSWDDCLRTRSRSAVQGMTANTFYLSNFTTFSIMGMRLQGIRPHTFDKYCTYKVCACLNNDTLSWSVRECHPRTDNI